MLETAVYKNIIRPLLFLMDAEEAHALGQKLLPPAQGLLEVVANRHLNAVQDLLPLLATSLAGRPLKNPIGLAAGFDKNARLLSAIGPLGFSYAEIGSVTAIASSGNPRPRIFRLPQDQALVNRLGLNGEGAALVGARMASTIKQASLPLALNIAPSNLPAGQIIMEEDIAATFACFKDLPLVYVTINTSCPNTHEGVLKESSQLRNILARVAGLNLKAVPIFLKLSPDASDDFLEHTMEIAREFGVGGFVLGNTSTTREGLISPPSSFSNFYFGGLSGQPVKERTLNLVRRVAKLKLPAQEIIACGGIESAADVIAAIKAGASNVQIYTALVYQGPFLVIQLQRDLALMLAAMDRSLQSLIGADI